MTHSPIYTFTRRCKPVLLYAVLGLTLVLGLSSCFKEKPIPQPYINNSGDIHVANMGENYTTQLYFNMQTQVFVDSNSKYAFDLAFDCEQGSYNIWLNGANLSQVCHTGKYNFSEASFADTVSKGWREELGSGVPADNAIGVWGSYPMSNKEIFIVNQGEDSDGNHLGFKKMQIGDCVGDSYNVTFCDMDGSNMHSVAVPRKANRNKVFLSFTDLQTHDFEPDYDNWDILFTQYSVYFPAQNLPYKVTGVLTNPHKTLAYFMDSTSDYDNIKLDSVQPSRFTTAQDNIGFEWKVYIGFLEYAVNPKRVYIVKSGNHYYKMRFIKFSNNLNQKGFPEFQYDELQ